jgi:ABC-type nitrate/sulfonate/bicarbonate transport system permease component
VANTHVPGNEPTLARAAAEEAHAMAASTPSNSWRRAGASLLPWLLPLILLAVWELASRMGWLASRVLPAPDAVLQAFWSLLLSGELGHHVAVSTGRAWAGWRWAAAWAWCWACSPARCGRWRPCWTPACRCCATSRRWR